MLQFLALGDDYILADGNAGQLGKSLRELLSQAVAACRAQEWEHARACCEAGKRVAELKPEYRGKINVKLAAGIVDYYLATTMVGQEEWEPALAHFQAAGDQLSFIAPTAGSAAWLAVARVHQTRNDPFSNLWALQNSWNLVEEQANANAESLRAIIDEEYKNAPRPTQ